MPLEAKMQIILLCQTTRLGTILTVKETKKYMLPTHRFKIENVDQ